MASAASVVILHNHPSGNGTVGEVQQVPASDLAAASADYAELATLGSAEIPTLYLNATYRPLKEYYESRLRATSEDAAGLSKDRYATGVGVGLLLLNQEREKLDRQEKPMDDEVAAEVTACIAKSVLSVLPEFDQLAQEAGLEAD